MNHLQKIEIKSTGEVLEFDTYNKTHKMYFYRYVKSIEKLGKQLPLTEEHLLKLIKLNT